MSNLRFTGGRDEGNPAFGMGGIKPLRFNAPVPSSLRNTNLYRSTDKYPWGKSIYLENQYNAVGLIVRDLSLMDAISTATGGWAKSIQNWGFQFHFNPSKIIESFQAPAGISYLEFIRDIVRNPIALTSTQSGAGMTLDLQLARREDMWILRREDWQSFYPEGSIFEDDREEILEKGTQYDLERFFRVVNLDPFETWRGLTSDWGMMVPAPVIISIGDSEGCRKVRAIVHTLNIQHQMYDSGTRPVYTSMSMSLHRIPDIYDATPTSDTAPPGYPQTGSDNDPGTVNDTNLGEGAGSPDYPPGKYPGWNGKFLTWGLPVPQSWVVGSGFKRQGRMWSFGHTGIDLYEQNSNSLGQSAYAVADGVVAKMYPNANGRGLGNELVIRTDAEGLFASYAHLERFAEGIAEGVKVKKGDVVGYVGRTGNTGGFAHLHLEVRTQVEWKKSWDVFRDPGHYLYGSSTIGWSTYSPHKQTR